MAVSPAKTVVGATGALVPKTGRRGGKRTSHATDGMHAGGRPSQAAEGTSSTYVEKTGIKRKKVKINPKRCQVCYQQGKMITWKALTAGGKERRSTPATTSYCTYCEAHVHGRGEPLYPDCWVHHLRNHVPGMRHSGDNKDAH